MTHLRDALVEIVEESHPIGVRGVAYIAVGRGLIEKDEGEFFAVGGLLVDLRREGRIPYESIIDSTRETIRSATYSSPAEVLRVALRVYRRDLWEGAESRVEIFVEKAGLAPLLAGVADPLCVPVSAFRGDASDSFLYEIAKRLREDGRPTLVLYFGDLDRAGLGIPRVAEKKLKEFAPHVELTFERVAVTPEQIKEYGLPTRPTKAACREQDFKGDSVELDAIPPAVLRELASDAILGHLDTTEVKKIRRREARERGELGKLVAGFEGRRP
jgi:hypothetical protein